MTKNMAIKELSERIQLIDENKYPVQEYREALVMAVQALKGFDIEQIRAEISIDLNNLKYNHDLTLDMNAGKYVGLKRALDVIDNYAK